MLFVDLRTSSIFAHVIAEVAGWMSTLLAYDTAEKFTSPCLSIK